MAPWCRSPGRTEGRSVSTIYDVARLADVSPATVSRVLNDRSDVNPEMARRVRASVEMLGYRPNSVARNLRRRVASVWALIISDIENPHFTALVRGVEDVASSNGYSVVLCNSDEELGKERSYIDVALAERMAGVVISPSSDRDSAVGPLLDAGVPVVTIDRRLRNSPVDSVVVTNKKGAQEATRHLLDGGYRRVACITGPTRTTTASQRLAGYRAALSEAGLSHDPSLVVVADYKEAGGAEAARTLLALPEPPDALFVANSLMTMGALGWLTEAGVSIPDQVGLVGFDDLPWSRLVHPRLTAVAQPTYHLGRTAAQMLVERAVDPGSSVRSVTLPTSLVVRDSSRR
ncbi:MAG: LacI family transcriptional regulator [Actinomycetota bacterium]|jgi:LacI family transcriptional regulator|nr:LacI family transcriptional regulator [Actinomycetota bacterium]